MCLYHPPEDFFRLYKMIGCTHYFTFSYLEDNPVGYVCHGAFHQHNILMWDSETAVVNFDNWNYDVQMADLYQFMRKILEKHGWDKELGKEMIQSYCEIRPLIKEERENLAVRFAYPEKFWKLANYYYTHNKVWIPKKNLEKLKKLISQYEKWLEFVESINTLEK